MINTLVVPITVSQNNLQVPMTLLDDSTIHMELSQKIEVIRRDVDYYEGDYIVTPSVHVEQVLDTNEKFLTDDVTVLKVPYYETSNEYGMTAYIGGD